MLAQAARSACAHIRDDQIASAAGVIPSIFWASAERPRLPLPQLLLQFIGQVPARAAKSRSLGITRSSSRRICADIRRLPIEIDGILAPRFPAAPRSRRRLRRVPATFRQAIPSRRPVPDKQIVGGPPDSVLIERQARACVPAVGVIESALRERSCATASQSRQFGVTRCATLRRSDAKRHRQRRQSLDRHCRPAAKAGIRPGR